MARERMRFQQRGERQLGRISAPRPRTLPFLAQRPAASAEAITIPKVYGPISAAAGARVPGRPDFLHRKSAHEGHRTAD